MSSRSRVKELEKECYRVYGLEEHYQKQRSRVDWLSKRGQNSKFFHMKAFCRSRKNSIVGREDGSGSWHVKDDKVTCIFVDYFSQIFSSMGSHDTPLHAVVDGLGMSFFY